MKNITTIGYKEHAKLNEVIIRLRSLPIFIIYMIAVLVFAGYGFYIKNWVIGIMGVSIVIIFPILSYFFLKNKIKKTYEQYKELYEKIHYEFEFSEEDVRLVLAQKDSCNELKKKYSELYQVIETKDYIFIFIDSKRAYIVSISGFDHFDRVEFRSLVQTSVRKYKILRK